jgi:NAD(P)-dependent dehydrogenase (short-subunit alcohol dehydrogenase family)
MAGTIIITGANSSLGLPSVQHLLTKYPDHTAILTVRNTSDTDLNTKKLREIVGRFPNAKADIRQLDLSSLSSVNDFATSVAAEIAEKKHPPLAAIVCNAYYWNLATDPDLTGDGYERTIQVNLISNVALVLRLVGSFGPSGGRVVLLASDAHWPGKNSLEKYRPGIPDDVDKLVQITPDKDKMGRGFEKYANSKLATVMWMYALNERLSKVWPYPNDFCFGWLN